MLDSRRTSSFPTEPLPWTQRSSVLVVDDDPNVREVLAELLRVQGFHVLTAANGREAESRVLAGRPDLIVLDLMMPQEDGWEFIERIRTFSAASAAPILLLSASCGLDEQAQRLHVAGFLPKPFDLDELLAKVNELAAIA